MPEIPHNIKEAICLVNDILIHDRSQEEHDHQSYTVQELDLTLNEKSVSSPKLEWSSWVRWLISQEWGKSVYHLEPLNTNMCRRCLSLLGHNKPAWEVSRQDLSVICYPARTSGVGSCICLSCKDTNRTLRTDRKGLGNHQNIMTCQNP